MILLIHEHVLNTRIISRSLSKDNVKTLLVRLPIALNYNDNTERNSAFEEHEIGCINDRSV